MATQQQVLEYIRSNYKHEPVADNIVKLLVPLTSGRTQMVYAGVTEEELQVTSPVAWQEKVSADRVLEANESMFGIVSINGAFGLKHNTFLEEINESEIEKAFVVLAVQADELERSLGFNDEF
jgi:hypothetical protein